MKKYLIVILCLFYFSAVAQNINLWSADTLALCNTAKDVTYMTEEEKKVILLMNLARINGNAFSNRIAQPYIAKEGLVKDDFVTSLLEDLSKTHGLPMLKPHQKLWESAAHHAYDMGHKGLIGHESSDGTTHVNRMQRYHKAEKMAESLCYGYNDAIEIVMQLLLDEGIELHSNRYHIIGSQYHHAGVSIKQHRVYDHNCVIDFSSH